MRLTLHLDYAMRSLIFLAAHPNERIKTGQISAAYGISKHHLVRVIQGLEKAGYVRLAHGRSGGIELARDPREIILGDVMRAMEPNMKLVECFDLRTNTCPILPVCKLKRVLKEASDAFVASLAQYSLADVATPRAALQKHLFVSS